MSNQLKTILITGVSTGIGYEAAKSCIKRGYTVFGSVRKQEDAARLKAELGSSYHPLTFDVTQWDDVESEINKVKAHLDGQGLHALINNSGMALGGPIQHQTMQHIEHHFQVNVLGLIKVTKSCLDMLGAKENCPHPPGKIINVSSISGSFAQPFITSYASSKAAVDRFSEGLRRELLAFDIKVVNVAPGPVKTPIWEKGVDMEPYMDTAYKTMLEEFAKAAQKGADKGLEAVYLGEKLADIVDDHKPKLSYVVLANKLTNWTIPMMLPKSMIDVLVKKQLKIK